jgi:ribA/ribD-fused uncharacterized protein
MNQYHFFYGGFLSQWWRCNFIIDGVRYNCAEQFMMASKARVFGDSYHEDLIMSADHPGTQKMFGRKIGNFNSEIWNKVARQFVYLGNLHKFTQNDDLYSQLRTTQGLLVEASPTDCVWGIGLAMDNPDRFNRAKWRGTNWLGEVLTQVRDDLLEIIN